jgi:hypothetical protein
VLKASGSSNLSVKQILRGVGRNYQHTPFFGKYNPLQRIG